MILQPLSPQEALRDVIDPALVLLERHMIGRPGPAPRAMLVAIGLQESALRYRAQILAGGGRGPARGLWQFERGGGVLGVLRHISTRAAAIEICRHHGVLPDSDAVWRRLETDDRLACAFARMLLWTDAQALPPARDRSEEAAWQYYLRTWRPGAFERDPVGLRSKWARHFRTALTTIGDPP